MTWSAEADTPTSAPRWSVADDRAVAAALEATETLELSERAVDELPGGQRQRVWIAMALAQKTEILLLDEPTTFVDVSHQVEVLDPLTDPNRAQATPSWRTCTPGTSLPLRRPPHRPATAASTPQDTPATSFIRPWSERSSTWPAQ